MAQVVINYYFNPYVTTVEEAINSIDLRQVGWVFLIGLLPGGRWIKSGLGALGDVMIYLLDVQAQCENLNWEKVVKDSLRIFATSFVIEVMATLWAKPWPNGVSKRFEVG